jgi:hypothetical protein
MTPKIITCIIVSGAGASTFRAYKDFKKITILIRLVRFKNIETFFLKLESSSEGLKLKYRRSLYIYRLLW